MNSLKTLPILGLEGMIFLAIPNLALGQTITESPQAGDPSYRGSVPQGTASATPLPLTLGEAIDRGLKANLGLLTSEQSSREIRAERYRALSSLLPKVNGQLSMTEQQFNLQALGFLFSFPPGLGSQSRTSLDRIRIKRPWQTLQFRSSISAPSIISDHREKI